MTKKEMIETIAIYSSAPKSVVVTVLESLNTVVEQQLLEHHSVTLHGLGTLTTANRSARVGRNPATGTPVDIPPSIRIGFKAAKALKDAVQVQD